MRKLVAQLRRGYRRLERGHAELFVAPWRAGLARHAQGQQDLLVALVYLEALGIENPASFVTIELLPELVEDFHAWHRRQGMETFPQPGVCC